MPEICRFFGIVIKMFFDDHIPPYFHAEYEYKAVIEIQSLVKFWGYLPPRSLGMVIEWASQHQGEFLDLSERPSNRQALYKLPPLE